MKTPEFPKPCPPRAGDRPCATCQRPMGGCAWQRKWCAECRRVRDVERKRRYWRKTYAPHPRAVAA